ncbi:MAG: RNA methyltransferase [Cyclobacteriaceae bacterium]
MRKLKNEELGRLSAEDFRTIDKNPVVLVLDNIRSMNNVGAAFRTSDAFLIEKIYLCGITAKPPHRDINKTALGATDTVAWEHFEHTLAAIEQLRSEGYHILSVEQAENSTMLNDFHPSENQKYAFVFGNEVFGVDQQVIDQSDDVIEIPQFGSKHSLNISVSIGIVLWETISSLPAVKE